MRFLLLSMLVLCLTACGQKGALYLPEEEQPAAQIAAPGVTLAAHSQQAKHK